MAFGLTIGTERTTALQNAIQDELASRGYSADADPVMAEYITIMIINNKTPEQITAELLELIGSDFDSSFVDWLFAEASKGEPASEVVAAPAPASATPATPSVPSSSTAARRDSPPHLPPQPQDGNRRPNARPGSGLYQQALTSALPTSQKRTRSPSPGHASKSRRTDLPTGPRAMQPGREPSGGRSLLERMGGRGGNTNGYANDDIQARIDNITGAGGQDMGMMGPQPPFPMNGMDMSGMPPPGMAGMPMGNPLMLQEMMMNQMALMAQMAGAMGMLGGPAPYPQGQPGFPMQPGMPVPQEMNMMNGDGGRGRGRGRGRGGHAGRGGGRGGAQGGHGEPSTGAEQSSAPAIPAQTTPSTHTAPPAPIAHPTPSHPRPNVSATFNAPTRPSSPTLCKFGLKCTNVQCRWSHPSPVATPESGVVLSNDPCEKGVKCDDKDCVKAHVSPAAARAASGAPPAESQSHTALNPKAPVFTPPSASSPPAPAPAPISTSSPTTSAVPCRYGLACTRPNCSFQHPPSRRLPGATHQPTTTTPCRFGAACTRATCPFVHPEGRGALPNTFHRGLGISGTGTGTGTGSALSSDGTSPNKSMKFTKPVPVSNGNGNGKGKVDGEEKESAKELEKRVKEVEERKVAAEKAVKEAEAAVASKKAASAAA